MKSTASHPFIICLLLSATASATGNVTPIQVGGIDTSANMPYVSITLCTPNTDDCQTISNIRLDSGSTGLRLKSSAVTINLTPETDSSQAQVAECWRFGGGEVLWGPIVQADIILANEKAQSVPIQLVNSAFASVPSNCSNLNVASDQNGVLGVGVGVSDIGNGLLTGDFYYVCTGNTCTPSSIPLALQIPNPVSMMPNDNNGVTISFPAIPPEGSESVTGSLILGIGTNKNNQPTSGTTVFKTDPLGWFKAIFQGGTYDTMLDTGTAMINPPTAFVAPNCSAYGWTGSWICATTTLNLSTILQSMDGSTTKTIDFNIGNAGTLMSTGAKAFDDVGYQVGGLTSNSLNLGMAFFYGKTVYFGISQKSTPLGMGPFSAF